MSIPSQTIRRMLAAFVLVLAGCGEAPHDNPLDPLSPKYENRGNLLVRVQSLYPPHVPLSGFALFLTPGNFFAHTNNQGAALFTNLLPGQYTLAANAAGYAADTVQIEVRARQTEQHTFELNAVPRITNVVVSSERISRWFPVNRDSYGLVVTAQAQDSDGAQDLTEVKLLSKTHGELKEMVFRPEIGKFEVILKDSDLPGKSLFDFIGEPLYIEARDREAAMASSEPLALARVIEVTPVAESPSGLKRTGVRPRFAWHTATVPYLYTFRVDISQFEPDQQFATLFESVNGIPPDSSAFLSNRDLPDGTYYWTVSIVDRHGNISRSKEATFEVQ